MKRSRESKGLFISVTVELVDGEVIGRVRQKIGFGRAGSVACLFEHVHINRSGPECHGGLGLAHKVSSIRSRYFVP